MIIDEFMPFIFLITIFAFITLAISFKFEIKFLAIISSMVIAIVGISILSVGITGLDNLLTLGLGIILTCIGAFVFINIPLQDILEQ